MINEPTNALPTAEERSLWQFDLAKRIVRLSDDGQQQLSKQAQEAIEVMQETNNDQQS